MKKKCAMLIMKSGKREATEGKELQNQEYIRIIIFTPSPLGQDVTQGQFLSEV